MIYSGSVFVSPFLQSMTTSDSVFTSHRALWGPPLHYEVSFQLSVMLTGSSLTSLGPNHEETY